MRNFLSDEQLLLESISKFKHNNDIESLRFSKILENLIPGYILSFSTTTYPMDLVTLYLKKSKEEIKPLYHKLIDLVLFIHELNELKLISIRRSNISNKNIFYDYSKFRCIDIKLDSLDNLKSNDNESISTENNYNSYFLNIQMGKLTHELMNAVIYPLPLLDDLVKSHFKDFEYRRFEAEQSYNRKNHLLTLKALKQSKCSIIISAFAVIISAISVIIPLVYEIWFSNNITTNDAQEIATAIKEHKTVTIDSVKTLPNDTFNVNVIQPRSNPAQKTQPQKKNTLKEQIPQ